MTQCGKMSIIDGGKWATKDRKMESNHEREGGKQDTKMELSTMDANYVQVVVVGRGDRGGHVSAP
jgi:hypothetical protein